MVVISGPGAPVTALDHRPAVPPGHQSRNPFRAQPAAYSPVAVAHVLDAGMQGIASGDLRERATRLLGERYGAGEVRLYDSGTAALQAALLHATSIIGRAAPVALPAFTCFEVATAAVGADLPIALFDVDPETLAPDLDSLERALRAGAKTVVVCTLYGIPFDWKAIEDRAAVHGALVIEDAAQGHGASWRGRPLGAHGRIATVSFGRGKGWTASGGGALLLRESSGGEAAIDRSLAESGIAHELRVIGAAAAQWALGRPAVYGLPLAMPWLGLGETHYHEPARPRAMTRASARLLVHTAAGAAREATARRGSAARWSHEIPDHAAIRRVHGHSEGVAGYIRYPVRLARGLPGFGAGVAEARRLGIASTYPATLSDLPAVRARLHGEAGRWPGAECLVRELVTLPTHSLLTYDERTRILELLAAYSASPATGR